MPRLEGRVERRPGRHWESGLFKDGADAFALVRFLVVAAPPFGLAPLAVGMAIEN